MPTGPKPIRKRSSAIPHERDALKAKADSPNHFPESFISSPQPVSSRKTSVAISPALKQLVLKHFNAMKNRDGLLSRKKLLSVISLADDKLKEQARNTGAAGLSPAEFQQNLIARFFITHFEQVAAFSNRASGDPSGISLADINALPVHHRY